LNDPEEGGEPSFRPPRIALPGSAQDDSPKESRRFLRRSRRTGSDGAPREPRTRRGRRIDLLIGIPLGIIAGLAIITAFLFLGSEGTIDAPRISGVDGGSGASGATSATGPSGATGPAAPGKPAPGPPPPPTSRPLPIVQIAGGAPPEATGGLTIEAKSGKIVRFRIEADVPTAIEIPKLSYSATVSTGDIVSVKPTAAGQYPVIVSGSEINVATLDASG